MPCVDNFAQPGFGVEQLWAVAREQVPETRPSVLVWELWDPQKHYSVVGDTAFDERNRATDARGVPVLPYVPEAAGDLLFRWSWGYQYAALALAPVLPPSSADRERIAWICGTVLPDVVRVAGLAKTRVVMLAAARLGLPLDTPAEPDMGAVIACAERQGIEVLSIAELLADQRVEDIRLDTCCHLNARGHALLAERLVPRLGLDAR